MKNSRLRITTSKRIHVSTKSFLRNEHEKLSLAQVTQKRRRLLNKDHQANQILSEAMLEVNDYTNAHFDSNDLGGFGDEAWEDDDSDASELNLHSFLYQRQSGKQTWKGCNRTMHLAWNSQLPSLVDAYLHWKHQLVELHTDPVTGRLFQVQVLGIREYNDSRNAYQRNKELANVTLLSMGLLGCSPIAPSLAITLETLEIYHQIHRRQPSFSIQAMVKVLCALNDITFSQSLPKQFSAAFDIYLSILRDVKSRRDNVLGRGSPDWHLRNQCPACSYRVDDEPPLVPARLHAMDGNFSAKQLDGAGAADERVFHSNYLIPPEEVDKFKDDVHSRSVASSNGAEIAPCPENGNWNAANNVSEETVKVFEQTGLFLCACHHGIVETFTEIRRSGELAKYGLATANAILQTFGSDQTIGSDIGCSFTASVAHSSLAQDAKIKRLHFVVNSFHGYAHKRSCQLNFHLLYIPGLGLEDFETCERVFSASNHVARIIRHSSYFHWLQFLDLHFQQWDIDRYTELSNFLYHNYKQALKIIGSLTPEIEKFKEMYKYCDKDFLRWREEEIQYLRNASHESEHDVWATSYVEALETLRKAERVPLSMLRYISHLLERVHYGSITTVPFNFVTYTSANFTPSGLLQPQSAMNAKAREAERRSAFAKLNLALNAVQDLEQRLGIVERWTPDHDKYRYAKDYMNNREFVHAVEVLKGQIVQRLFELSKANLAGTGYKMRRHIAKAIARRSSAIRNSLEKYNRLAPLQSPPRPQLDFATVANYVWLGDIELFKYSCHDMLNKPWTVQANRDVAAKYFKVLGARAELVRLNVEIRHLSEWVECEDSHLTSVAERLNLVQPNLAAEVYCFAKTQHRINNIHHKRLSIIYNLEGYTGFIPEKNPSNRVLVDACDNLFDTGTLDPDEDDIVADEAARLTDYLEAIN